MSDTEKKSNPANMPALQSGRLKESAKTFRHLFFQVPHGTTPEMVLETSYYRHEWMKLQPLDRLTAFAEDGTWERDLRVMFVSKAGAQVSPIGPVSKHANKEVVSIGDYEPRYISAALKWCVVRRADNERIKEKLPSEEAALQAITEMKKAA